MTKPMKLMQLFQCKYTCWRKDGSGNQEIDSRGHETIHFDDNFNTKYSWNALAMLLENLQLLDARNLISGLLIDGIFDNANISRPIALRGGIFL